VVPDIGRAACTAGVTVTALHAYCDQVTWEEYRTTLECMQFRNHELDQEREGFAQRASFAVGVVAVLDDGREIPVRDDSGFSMGVCSVQGC
jgi:hypothetical protein